MVSTKLHFKAEICITVLIFIDHGVPVGVVRISHCTMREFSDEQTLRQFSSLKIIFKMLFGQRITESQEILFNYGHEHNGEKKKPIVNYFYEREGKGER